MFAARGLLMLPSRGTSLLSHYPPALRTCTQRILPGTEPTRSPPSSRTTRPRQAASPFPSSPRRSGPRRTKEEWQWHLLYRRAARQERSYHRPAYNYRRYQAAQGLLYRWAARPTFYYEVGGIGLLCASLYVANLEAVPVSGRRRFNIVSVELERSLGQQRYAETMREFGRQLMAPGSREHRLVLKVMRRLLPFSGLEGEAWEIHVIDDAMQNAFVIPGGRVFVFRGILDLCPGEDGLAAVLGHEIAHVVAHHAAERMSKSLFTILLPVIGYALGFDLRLSQYIFKLALELPGSRAQEEEADYIGLMMMAEACYNPAAAIGLWRRMEQEEQRQGTRIPQFLSTHPSSHNRQEKIRAWVPEAEAKRQQVGCGELAGVTRDFRGVADLTRIW